jgi:hypothetical protein
MTPPIIGHCQYCGDRILEGEPDYGLNSKHICASCGDLLANAMAPDGLGYEDIAQARYDAMEERAYAIKEGRE